MINKSGAIFLLSSSHASSVVNSTNTGRMNLTIAWSSLRTAATCTDGGCVDSGGAPSAADNDVLTAAGAGLYTPAYPCIDGGRR